MSELNTATDSLNPLLLRIDPAIGADLGVKKALLHVPVRKPNRQEFFRTNPHIDYRMTMAILEMKEDREIYAVMPNVVAGSPGETRIVELRLCVNRAGSVYLWPVPLPTPDGRENAWHKIAREAAQIAETEWVRMAANMGAGCYDVFIAPPGLSEPRWPEESFVEMLRIAFGGGRTIDGMDHPVVARLRGL